jgi:hypothetical protein
MMFILEVVCINLRTNAAEVGPLRNAVRAVLDEPGYRARAAAMAKEFARIDTRAEILRIARELAGHEAAKAQSSKHRPDRRCAWRRPVEGNTAEC